MELSCLMNFRFFQIPPANLSEIIPNASLEAIDLIQQLCSWDPQRRPTAEQSLQHPFFHVGAWVPYPLKDPFHPTTSQTGKVLITIGIPGLFLLTYITATGRAT
ncbi:cyclin-dependent kinase F-3-like [Ananas comosus]|uniref:Cyclin-dependent kinase F-3-like n=1 Tax=Ananas comosus TaxID=4615 RepID=A0A6P5EE12_ANACO|nr:cyclin-dependent kinase F-3-like [Ananas comosus]